MTIKCELCVSMHNYQDNDKNGLFLSLGEMLLCACQVATDRSTALEMRNTFIGLLYMLFVKHHKKSFHCFY